MKSLSTKYQLFRMSHDYFNWQQFPTFSPTSFREYLTEQLMRRIEMRHAKMSMEKKK